VERFYATRAAIEMAVDHPVLGIGLDQFLTQYLGHYKPPQATQDLDSAHTMWPEVAAELGFPALAMVLLIYAAALLASWRVYRAPPDEFMRLLATALLAAQAAWLAVATAYAGDMYRDWRNMASDYVMMMVLMAASFALYLVARREAAGATAGATASATTEATAQATSV
jgi:O-antigen ligase